MGSPVEKPRRATYADLAAVPSQTTSDLGVLVGGPFGFGLGGPGGWRIFDWPELHLGAEGLEDILVPDLAGWRVERLPELPEEAYFTVVPDWVCEVLSPSTAADDRADKMPLYAREGVVYLWLIDPLARTLEVFKLDADRRWVLLGIYRGAVKVRAAPFDAVELDLAPLWAR